MKKESLYQEIKEQFPDFLIKGNFDLLFFTNAKSISKADNNSIVWCAPKMVNKLGLIETTEANLIVCDPSLNISKSLLESKCFIIHPNPRLAFIKIITKFLLKTPEYGIHPSSVIHPSAVIHEKTYIGPNTYIGKCEIGEGTIVYGNNFLYDDVYIGKNVIINAGSIVGAAGFGYEMDEQGRYLKFPHLGGVIIADNVEIGSNTCVDKGTLDNTVIKEGAKIDNLVHIAHNVIIGENAMVIALSMVGGSTVIGDDSWVSPGAALRDGLHIGENTLVGMGSVVTKNIPANEIWIGNPAKFYKLKQ